MTRGSNHSPTTIRPSVQSLVANSVRCFPTELLHEVITYTLSRYLSDVLIAPESTRSWNAIGTLLHVDYQFRSCTVNVLDALWDGTFLDFRSGCVSFDHCPGIPTQSKEQQKASTRLHSQDRISASTCRTRTAQSDAGAPPRAPCTLYAPEHATVRAYRALLRCIPSTGEHVLSQWLGARIMPA